MDYFSLKGVTLTTFFDTRRSKEDEFTFPVKYRVTFNRSRVYYASGINLTEEEWKILPTTRKKELSDTRELIQNGFDKVKNHIKELVTETGFSFQGLNQRLKQNKQNSLYDELLSKIENLEKEGRPGTASSYRCANNSLMKYKPKSPRFGDVTPEWLHRYEKWMVVEGNSLTTVGIYMRCIRAIINENRGFITSAQYPFGKGRYEIKQTSGRKMALSLDQINAIMKLPLPTQEAVKYRDLFFFSFLCNGANVNDILRLKFSNIENNEILFLRGKTIRTDRELKEIRATLLPEMQRIIEKWGNPDTSSSNYIFPFLTDDMTPLEIRTRVQDVTRRINLRLKKIAKELGYPVLSTYSARHSFASILKNHNVNVQFISEALGHSNLATTQTYLASFDHDERAKIATILTNNKTDKSTSHDKG